MPEISSKILSDEFGTFYTTTRTFFSIDGIKKKGKRRYKGYSMKMTGETISDEEIEKLFSYDI